jgi:uncharacterized protein
MCRAGVARGPAIATAAGVSLPDIPVSRPSRANGLSYALMAELLVRGRAEGRLAPSHATFDITVEAREPSSQQAALDRAAAACALVDDAVRRGREGTDPLIRRAETSSIRTAEHWDYGAGGQRRRLGWLAERRTRIECAPVAEDLTALVGQLAHNDIRVSGPQWHVAPHAPGWDELRTAAVIDARRRAVAYAAGIDAQVGAVRWIAEPGMRRDGAPDGFPATPLRSAALAMESGDQPEPLPVQIAVEPVAIEITVEAAFDLADVG